MHSYTGIFYISTFVYLILWVNHPNLFLLIKVSAFIKVTFFLIHSGLSTHLLTALHKLSDFGGAGVEAIKKAIDSIFTEGSRSHTENFLEKLVATTSDGASVNFGRKEGLLKRLINDGRPGMIKCHCANHRIELAVKDVLKDSAFSEVDKQYLAIFNLMKNLGAVKHDVKSAAKALEISCCTLPKIMGNSFGFPQEKGLHLSTEYVASVDHSIWKYTCITQN